MISFLAAQYGTVSDIELVWVVIATIGLCFSIYNLSNALADRRALKKSGNARNGRWLLASFSLRAETARLFIQLIFLAIGAVAMLLPDPPDQTQLPTKQFIAGIVIRWGLVTAALLVTLKSYWGYELRNTLTYTDGAMKSEYSVPGTKKEIKQDSLQG